MTECDKLRSALLEACALADKYYDAAMLTRGHGGASQRIAELREIATYDAGRLTQRVRTEAATPPDGTRVRRMEVDNAASAERPAPKYDEAEAKELLQRAVYSDQALAQYRELVESSQRQPFHEGTLASNTPEVWRRAVGERIAGAFFVNPKPDDDNSGTIWLVLGGGAALCITAGAWWRAEPGAVKAQRASIAKALEAEVERLRDVQRIAGEP